MMTDLNAHADAEADDRDIRPEMPGEEEFDAEAQRARRRQYALAAGTVLLLAIAVVAVPWREHVDASGRIAPQRWARLRSDAAGVLREVRHTAGDTVEANEVIAVLDFDAQRDALEAARLALTRERQKLADLEIRLRENAVQRQGANTLAGFASERTQAARRVDASRIAALDPAADATLNGVRAFTAGVRAELARARSARANSEFNGEQLFHEVRESMERYSEAAAALGDDLSRVGGSEAGRQFGFELEDLHFAYTVTDHSMEDILSKLDLVARGIVASVTLRDMCVELERQSMELAHGFRALSANARNVLGSKAEQGERMRVAEESRRLLASETERLETQRASVESDIAAAELAVRAAERQQGKTEIRAPIRGTIAQESLSRFDAVAANAAVGVVQDTTRVVLKLRVDDAAVPRIRIGQQVEARARNGRSLHGTVTWAAAQAGQQVRDQAWNVLIQVDGDSAGVNPGEKVTASIDVGRRSLLRRWWEPEVEEVAGATVAALEDPTELHDSALARTLPGVNHEERLAAERMDARRGTDGS